MNYPRISFLLPTRGRTLLVWRLFQSIAKTTARLDRIDVVLYADEDDSDSHDLDSTDFQVTRIIAPTLSMGGLNSACLKKAQGDVIILINDDVVIRTPSWDDQVFAMDAKFKDRIYLGYGNDLHNQGRFSTFPIISRRTCELLGDPYPATYQRAFIDVHLFDIFKRLQHIGFDRICYCNDLVFEHLHYRSGKSAYDATYAHAASQRFSDDKTFIALTAMRSVATENLFRAIHDKPVIIGSNDSFQVDVVKGLPSAILLFFRKFLLQGKSPYRWRFFLFWWFTARYVWANILLPSFARGRQKAI